MALPPLSSSDHNIIHLIPIYKPLLKSGQVATRKVEMWSGNAVEELTGALECSDWSVFNHSADLDERTEVISSYILYFKGSQPNK